MAFFFFNQPSDYKNSTYTAGHLECNATKNYTMQSMKEYSRQLQGGANDKGSPIFEPDMSYIATIISKLLSNPVFKREDRKIYILVASPYFE